MRQQHIKLPPVSFKSVCRSYVNIEESNPESFLGLSNHVSEFDALLTPGIIDYPRWLSMGV